MIGIKYKYKINPFSGKLDIVTAGAISAGTWHTPADVTISGGAATLDGPGRYLIDTPGAAASADLNTIAGLSNGNEVLLMAKSPARTIVLKNGVGNLRIGADFRLDSAYDVMRLQCNASLDCCEAGGRSSNG